MFDSDKITLLFDIKPSSLGTIFPGTEGRRYSAKWEENFPGYITQTSKMQDCVLTVLAFGSHTDRNDVFTGFGFTEWKKSQFKKKEYWYHTANLENTKMQPVGKNVVKR